MRMEIRSCLNGGSISHICNVMCLNQGSKLAKNTNNNNERISPSPYKEVRGEKSAIQWREISCII